MTEKVRRAINAKNGLNAPFWNILRVYTVYTPVFLCNIRAKTEQMSNSQSVWCFAINGRFTRNLWSGICISVKFSNEVPAPNSVHALEHAVDDFCIDFQLRIPLL